MAYDEQTADKWHGRIVFISLILYVTWMQRNGRWGLFLDALTGKYQVTGSRLVAPIVASDISSGADTSAPDVPFEGGFSLGSGGIPELGVAP